MIPCSFLACAQARRRLALHGKHQRATRVRGRCTWRRTRLSRDTDYAGRLDRAGLLCLATHTLCEKRDIQCMYDTASETCRPNRYDTVQVLPLAPPTSFHVVRAALLNHVHLPIRGKKGPAYKTKGATKNDKISQGAGQENTQPYSFAL